MTAETGERLRADARRNRDQIVAAAKEIFASRGVDVPMEEIARAASVGVGTLYRRFPDRDALVCGVARDAFGATLAAARAAVDEEPTSWDALERIIRHAVDMRLVTRLFSTSDHIRVLVKRDPDVVVVLRPIMELVDRLVDEAQAEGMLRADIGMGDLLLMYSALMNRTAHTDDEETWRLATERGLGILLDGLCARPGSRLPGRKLTRKDVGPRI